MEKKVKLLLSWDDFDRLRKVPSNIANIVDGFEVNIGKPYTMIKDPFKTDKSYGYHFEHEFEKSLEELGIKLEIRRQTLNYTSGKYLEGIKTALSKRKEIYDIIMNYKTQSANDEERENYYPVSVYCKKSMKDNTKVLSYNEKENKKKQFAFFKTMYKILLGEESGPALYILVLSAGAENILKVLKTI